MLKTEHYQPILSAYKPLYKNKNTCLFKHSCINSIEVLNETNIHDIVETLNSDVKISGIVFGESLFCDIKKNPKQNTYQHYFNKTRQVLRSFEINSIHDIEKIQSILDILPRNITNVFIYLGIRNYTDAYFQDIKDKIRLDFPSHIEQIIIIRKFWTDTDCALYKTLCRYILNYLPVSLNSLMIDICDPFSLTDHVSSFINMSNFPALLRSVIFLCNLSEEKKEKVKEKVKEEKIKNELYKIPSMKFCGFFCSNHASVLGSFEKIDI